MKVLLRIVGVVERVTENESANRKDNKSILFHILVFNHFEWQRHTTCNLHRLLHIVP